ncbi:unnamed protein product [Caenorhabditis angaria]|uniref:Uncharacterized protein n=1 Tax=Caenorhabditis angaria TaxID=860376 RepID=A0A9P1I4X1_9PELO|nr:unnamed protein product [Caenorhabditis angaria]
MKSLTSLYILSFRILEIYGHLINSEIAKDLSVYICSHGSTYSHANMNFIQYPVQFCVSLRSNKGIREHYRDLQSSTSLQGTVQISWRQLATANSCKLTFKGYQTEYRISPDLGGYIPCQNAISRHLFRLSQSMNFGSGQIERIEFNNSNSKCPIENVPTAYPEYISCKLQQNEWYMIEWKSTTRYETFRNGEYGTHWANDTQSFVVKMSEELRRNGTELIWLQRLVKLDSRLNGCDDVKVLVNFADDWTIRTNTITLTYRIFDGTMKIHSKIIGTFDIENWREIQFPLKRTPGDHQICAQMNSPVPSRYLVCRKIVDSMTSVFYEDSSWEDRSFARNQRQLYESTNDLVLLTVFRKNESKYFWFCAACRSKTNSFKNLLSLRLFALDHLRSSHSEENPDIEQIVKDEWKLVKEETNFDVEKLMEISRTRRDVKNQSRRKFYMTNLKSFENGQHFEEYLKNTYYKKDEDEEEQRKEKDYRFCFICLELVEKSDIDQHFRGKSHTELESHSHVSTFFELPSSVITKDFYDSDLTFPKDIFAYCTVYKTLHRDMFKWRCCLCPNTHAHTFVTFIVLRMYALRHIEANHNYLFREQFIESEWNIIKYELQIGFDVQKYLPTFYTIRGENTFNPHNPNDFTLPQQYYFIPQEFVKHYSICGFCFKSFPNREFIRHIVSHGFVEENGGKLLKRAETSAKVEELMESTNQFDAQKLDEPVKMLTIEGKQLKAKIEEISENASSISNSSTRTQQKRKSALDAKQLLSKTFEILKENFKKTSKTWDDPMNSNFSSSSSSSDQESSNDEYKASKNENRKFRRNRKMLSNSIKYDDFGDNSQMVLQWIQEQASKRGLDCNFNKDSSDEDTGIIIKKENVEEKVRVIKLPNEEKPVVMLEEEKEEEPEFVEPENRKKVVKKRVRFQESTKKGKKSNDKSNVNLVPQGNLNYSSMTPVQVRELIQNAAKERGIVFDSTSSESDLDSDSNAAPQSRSKSKPDSIFDKMSPDQMRLYLKIQAAQRGIQNGFVNSSSDSSDQEDEEEKVVKPTTRQTRKRKCARR